MNVCIGGTFNIFHRGHKLLIDTAIDIAGKNGCIFIGITTGEMIKFKNNIKSFESRKDTILEYLLERGYKGDLLIEPIRDKYGPSITGEFDVIVVSPETIRNADDINLNREKIGKKRLKIIEIPFVLAGDNKPISSTRIQEKEIDTEGHLLNKN